MGKKRTTISVDPKVLQKWDEFAASLGTTRTAMICNAVRVYELFMTKQLENGRNESIKEQIDIMFDNLKNFMQRKEFLTNDNKRIDAEFEKREVDIQDFEVVADKILKLLQSWGELPESTITAHLSYPGWLTWTVLKKLQASKKVKITDGKWSIY